MPHSLAMKAFRYFLEALLLSFALLIFKCMPARMASDVGGWIGRTIGPRLAASRKALRNLERAMPELNVAQRQDAIAGMWNNLGRVMAEYPHLETLARAHTEIVGAERVKEAMASGHGVIFIGGHIGNWEINSIACLMQLGLTVDVSYRAPNNPWVDRLLLRMRSVRGQIKAHAKSRVGGRGIMEHIKDGGAIGILIDQKYREGMEMPFFDMPAKTNPFFAQLALKYNAKILPIRCERLDGAQFRFTIYEPLSHEGKSVETLIGEAHALMEGWIRERPAQWLWLHRRWKD
jgi:KDO2-lipid IV(A) lauroyltransferase